MDHTTKLPYLFIPHSIWESIRINDSRFFDKSFDELLSKLSHEAQVEIGEYTKAADSILSVMNITKDCLTPYEDDRFGSNAMDRSLLPDLSTQTAYYAVKDGLILCKDENSKNLPSLDSTRNLTNRLLKAIIPGLTLKEVMGSEIFKASWKNCF